MLYETIDHADTAHEINVVDVFDQVPGCLFHELEALLEGKLTRTASVKIMRGDGEYDGGSEGRRFAKRRRGLGRHKSFVRNLNRYYQEAFGRRKWDRTNYVLHETRSADHNLSVASSLMEGDEAEQ